MEDPLRRLIGIGRNDVPVADLGNLMYQIRVSGWTSKFWSTFREAENVSFATPGMLMGGRLRASQVGRSRAIACPYMSHGDARERHTGPRGEMVLLAFRACGSI